MRTRLYELYPGGPSGLSNQSVDYHGRFILVAAGSIRQAYWLAGHMKWAASADAPVGVIESYIRGGPDEGWHELWDGCRIHHGLGLRSGASKTAITRAMKAHEDRHQS